MSPSGEQVQLQHGDYRATVVEVGGGVRAMEHAGEPVLDGYPEDQMASAGRGALLVPWPNRLHGGRYTWDGVTGKVPIDEPDQQNAIHGLARYRSWTPTERTDASVTMRLLLRPQPAYPFTVSFAARYELGDDGLTVTMSATNEGDRDAPYGCGVHPYLTAGTARLDDTVLRDARATHPVLIVGDRESPSDTYDPDGVVDRYNRPLPPPPDDAAVLPFDVDSLAGLRRFVQASSRPGDLCLDPFAGSGTLGAVAAKLDRRYLLIDESPEAVRVMRERLEA